MNDTTELAGRIVTDDGDLVEFITLSYGSPDHADDAERLMAAQKAAIAEQLDGTELRLVDRYGDEVIPDE